MVNKTDKTLMQLIIEAVNGDEHPAAATARAVYQDSSDPDMKTLAHKSSEHRLYNIDDGTSGTMEYLGRHKIGGKIVHSYTPLDFDTEDLSDSEENRNFVKDRINEHNPHLDNDAKEKLFSLIHKDLKKNYFD